MAANNQGIDHISRKTGSTPLCNNRRAHMSISIEQYRNDHGTGLYCKRCEAKLAKMDASKARQEAKGA